MYKNNVTIPNNMEEPTEIFFNAARQEVVDLHNHEVMSLDEFRGRYPAFKYWSEWGDD